MANQEHLDILAKGVETWNAWRRHDTGTRPDLDRANLVEVNLENADFSRATLYRVDFNRANLSGVIFHDAVLAGASLRSADLSHAVLQGADLHIADLSRARLFRADLVEAVVSSTKLDETDLERAIIGDTVFGNVDLRTTKGLDSVIHQGPSTVGLDTIYRSEGKIPESFLRRAGLPNNFIAFMRSLTSAAFEFYSCFISYSTHDQDFADRLYADLQARGVRCWFAPHDIQGGRKVHEQIYDAIRLYDKLLLILSDASMNSPWVRTEIANARAREESQKRQMLFPITLVPFDRIKEWRLFDADRGIDSAREIREYFIPDFSNWKDHDSYQKAFDRLLRDLKAEGRERATA